MNADINELLSDLKGIVGCSYDYRAGSIIESQATQIKTCYAVFPKKNFGH